MRILTKAELTSLTDDDRKLLAQLQASGSAYRTANAIALQSIAEAREAISKASDIEDRPVQIGRCRRTNAAGTF